MHVVGTCVTVAVDPCVQAPAPDDIHAGADRDDRTLVRLVPASQPCGSREIRVRWNVDDRRVRPVGQVLRIRSVGGSASLIRAVRRV